MNRPDYKAVMNRFTNEYRGLMIDIRGVRRSNNDLPSKEEGRLYQRAAEICSEMANMNVGAEAEYWRNEQIKCSEKQREIAYFINPEMAKKLEQGDQKDKKGKDGKAADNQPTTKSSPAVDEVVTEKMIASWFEEMPSHGFEKIAGMSEVKEKLKRSLQSIGWIEVRKLLKMSPIQSFFFIGPPGCGKTYIVEAFTHELMTKYGFQYMHLSGGDIHSRYVGDAEKIVERAFEVAQEKAPCIMFIDEFDSVCRNRSAQNLPEHVMSTTTSFLEAFNKLKSKATYEKPVIFIAATNYPQNVDEAMLDRVELVHVPLPDQKAREHAFESKLEETGIPYSIGCDEMAAATEKYNYRDIERLLEAIKVMIFAQLKDTYEEAGDAVSAVKNKEVTISNEMFQEALEKCMASPKDDILLDLEQWLNKLDRYGE